MKRSLAIKFKLLKLCIVISCLWSCENILKENKEKYTIERVPLKADTHFTSFQSPPTIDSTSESHLFGRFFADRAEYFIIKNPLTTLYQQKVNNLTLYYLDGELCQTKQVVDNDIATSLVNTLGSFSIVGFDSLNKSIIKRGDILIKTGEIVGLNPSLTNYELRWKKSQHLILYRVNKFDKDTFRYVERSYNFQKVFSQIEKCSI